MIYAFIASGIPNHCPGVSERIAEKENWTLWSEYSNMMLDEKHLAMSKRKMSLTQGPLLKVCLEFQ